MFKPLFIRIIESTVTGRPVQAFLAEASSISRKTWDAGGPKRPAAKARAVIKVQEFVIQSLCGKGMSETGIEAWLSRFPETTYEYLYCLSTLVRMFPVGQGAGSQDSGAGVPHGRTSALVPATTGNRPAFTAVQLLLREGLQ